MNSERVYKDSGGSIFIPMNMEGYGDEGRHFITSTKLAAIAIEVVTLVFIIADIWMTGSGWPLLLIWFIISIYVVRYIIFEEKLYYKMYEQLKDGDVFSPGIFWEIASINDTPDGALMTYTNGSIGIVCSVDRGTTTGRPDGFKETHIDAISDFYRHMMNLGYTVIQMNNMVAAGQDPRLDEIGKIVYNSPNPSVRNIVEKQVGHIKKICADTLYEEDYFFIIGNDINKRNVIFNDAIDSLYILLGGNFTNYRFLNSNDIVELRKEEFGIASFDPTEASLAIYKDEDGAIQKPFDIEAILWESGSEQVLDNKEKQLVNNYASVVYKEGSYSKKVKGEEEVQNLSDLIFRRQKVGDLIDYSDIFNTKKDKAPKNKEVTREKEDTRFVIELGDESDVIDLDD